MTGQTRLLLVKIGNFDLQSFPVALTSMFFKDLPFLPCMKAGEGLYASPLIAEADFVLNAIYR